MSAIEVREVDSVADLTEMDGLFTALWGASHDSLPVNVMKALAHTGNYVVAAYRAGGLVGASVAFVWGDLSPVRLHSHITGVAASAQGAGVGYALKLHQREWALSRGVQEITWTFDPLVRRNAWFNLMKLGARADRYYADFYGLMADSLNGNDPTDRCFVTWDLTGARDRFQIPSADAGPVILQEGPTGIPQPCSATMPPERSPILFCQVPADISDLRQRDPELARRWRYALRETMGAAMESGYVARSITPDGRYVMTREPR